MNTDRFGKEYPTQWEQEYTEEEQDAIDSFYEEQAANAYIQERYGPFGENSIPIVYNRDTDEFQYLYPQDEEEFDEDEEYYEQQFGSFTEDMYDSEEEDELPNEALGA